ncbi:D-lactate dehydrognease 2, putative [Pediculus humanus corporis]|uniref:D-2-hydroxyglutarate dehydrogenase, mitochondrial n=1 Tax=Pediculus humanus subsp. corporis TaxID=121224 RepID=E0VRB6_PEDHC|nr:D-lactate dehydrognease 2, putative [Pediculus humanus corporis]EEB15922.1 D-lactate dehydrognease 2, putative [Pediculus humanus corporis]
MFFIATNLKFNTSPEEAKIRFPEIKRKCFNKLSSRDVEYFVSVLGKDRVISDLTDVEPYNIDFARHIKGNSEIVLKPKSTEEISSILKYCNENQLGVCPQGGNSGLVSGSVPVFDEIIISTVLMNKIINFDEFSGYDKTIEGFKLNNPFGEKYKFYMLLETRSSMDGNDLEKVNGFLEKMMEKGLALDAVFKNGYAYKYDISLPHENFYKLVEIMKEKLKGTSATLVTGYGHLGDGNLHLNICSESYDKELKDQIEPFVFELTQKFKGSISAEHGIGLEKPEFLHLSKSKSSINLMKNIKNLLDPNGILNPYKVLPPSC